MPCSIIFLMILQTNIVSIVTSDFLEQMIILKFCNTLLCMPYVNDKILSLQVTSFVHLEQKGSVYA